MDPAGLFSAVTGRPLPDAAGMLAAAGVPVFPCAPGGKRPTSEHGFHDATTDPEQVTAWWRRWPKANIGVPTGHESGWEVVDVDRKSTGSGFAAFDRARRMGLVPGWVALVRTPSGGMHAFFPADPYRAQTSWQAARVHVDFRGAGGYVVVPPSVVEMAGGARAGYELIGGTQPHAAAVDAKALRDFLDPRPEPSFRSSTSMAGVVDAEQLAGRLAGWVATLGEGERNRGLFWAACRLAENGIRPTDALDVLSAAASHAGLPDREIAATVRSAYRTAHTTTLRSRTPSAPVTDSPVGRGAGLSRMAREL